MQPKFRVQTVVGSKASGHVQGTFCRDFLHGLGFRVEKGPMEGPEFRELPIKVHLERTSFRQCVCRKGGRLDGFQDESVE